MKKLFALLLSALMCFCFAACDKPKGQHQVFSTTYYGVVQTIENSDGLFVYIPEVGVCDIPSYKDGQQQDITVKEGDLIRMDFDGAEVEFMERYPIEIKTPVKSMTVGMENVALEQDENEYILTIDYTQALKDEFLMYEKDVGDMIYCISYQGMAGTVNRPSMQMIFIYCTAKIEGIANDRLSLLLQLDGKSIQEFLNKVATGKTEIKAFFVGDENALAVKEFNADFDNYDLFGYNKSYIFTNYTGYAACQFSLDYTETYFENNNLLVFVASACSSDQMNFKELKVENGTLYPYFSRKYIGENETVTDDFILLSYCVELPKSINYQAGEIIYEFR